MTNEEFIESIRLKGEEWRDVVGYEGLYVVSSLGRIVSLGHTQVINPYGKDSYTRRCVWKQKILKPIVHRTKRKTHYFNVALRKDGEYHRFLWHRVVASAFIPNPFRFPYIDHINGDKGDNRVENLRWCNSALNMSNPITRDLISSAAKGRPSRLKKPVVAIFYNHIKEYPSAAETAIDGFSPNLVAMTCRGVNKSHKGIKWMWKSDYETLVSMSKNSTGLPSD